MWFSGWMAMAWVNLSLQGRLVMQTRAFAGVLAGADVHGIVKVLVGHGLVAQGLELVCGGHGSGGYLRIISSGRVVYKAR